MKSSGPTPEPSQIVAVRQRLGALQVCPPRNCIGMIAPKYLAAPLQATLEQASRFRSLPKVLQRKRRIAHRSERVRVLLARPAYWATANQRLFGLKPIGHLNYRCQQRFKS